MPDDPTLSSAVWLYCYHQHFFNKFSTFAEFKAAISCQVVSVAEDPPSRIVVDPKRDQFRILQFLRQQPNSEQFVSETIACCSAAISCGEVFVFWNPNDDLHQKQPSCCSEALSRRQTLTDKRNLSDLRLTAELSLLDLPVQRSDLSVNNRETSQFQELFAVSAFQIEGKFFESEEFELWHCRHFGMKHTLVRVKTPEWSKCYSIAGPDLFHAYLPKSLAPDVPIVPPVRLFTASPKKLPAFISLMWMLIKQKPRLVPTTASIFDSKMHPIVFLQTLPEKVDPAVYWRWNVCQLCYFVAYGELKSEQFILKWCDRNKGLKASSMIAEFTQQVKAAQRPQMSHLRLCFPSSSPAEFNAEQLW